jgi:hypothetical protein
MFVLSLYVEKNVVRMNLTETEILQTILYLKDNLTEMIDFCALKQQK